MVKKYLCLAIFALHLSCNQKGNTNKSKAVFYDTITGIVDTNVSKLALEESGIVEDVLVKPGLRVKKNQILARLNDNSLLIDLKTLKKKGAQLEVEIKHYTDTVKRQEGLRKRKLIQVSKLAESKFALDKAIIGLAINNLEIQKLTTKIEGLNLFSPMDGVVFEVKKSIGDSYSPNEVIVVIQNAEEISLRFFVPTYLWGKIKKGQRIQFESDLNHKKQFAIIDQIVPRIDSGFFIVLARVEPGGLTIPYGTEVYMSYTQ